MYHKYFYITLKDNLYEINSFIHSFMHCYLLFINTFIKNSGSTSPGPIFTINQLLISMHITSILAIY